MVYNKSFIPFSFVKQSFQGFIPIKTGIYNLSYKIDSHFRGNDNSIIISIWSADFDIDPLESKIKL